MPIKKTKIVGKKEGMFLTDTGGRRRSREAIQTRETIAVLKLLTKVSPAGRRAETMKKMLKELGWREEPIWFKDE